MAYNKDIALVSISKRHHALLKTLAKGQKRNLQSTTELLIEQASIK